MARRRTYSIRRALIERSRQAALHAVDAFNSSLATFRSETFIVLMVIAWTYLLHAHYRSHDIEYRHFERKNGRRRFHRTKHGAFKFWELERCLDEDDCPVDAATTANLKFLIGLRHEIEHQGCLTLDLEFGSRYQACCLNYEFWLTRLFGDRWSVAPHVMLTVQFREVVLNRDEPDQLASLPTSVARYIRSFDESLPEEVFNSPRYAYRLLFTRKLANRPGQADRVLEFIDESSPLSEQLQKQYWVIKDRERPKYRAKTIVEMMRGGGFVAFNMHHHTVLWQTLDAKRAGSQYGVSVEGQWYWYEPWVDLVRKHCRDHAENYQTIHRLGA